MEWIKLGHIIKPQTNMWWMRTHAMVPTPFHIGGDSFRIYFCGRDNQNRSQIGSVTLDINAPEKSIVYSRQPVLEMGQLGCFDDNGVTPSCILQDGDKILLYYIGWKPRSTTRFSLLPGLAISEDMGQTFVRYSKAPILALTDLEPISILTAPCVLKDGSIFRMWYVSGIDWVNPDLPRYNIKYAESRDGKVWDQTGIVCIDNQNQNETALARPWVIKENGKYKMWFSYKIPPATYRCGYAESDDGIKWLRKDNEAGISVSETGWDSEMVEYFAVFDHHGKKYMLYNGNGFGTTGAGLAVLKDEK